VLSAKGIEPLNKALQHRVNSLAKLSNGVFLHNFFLIYLNLLIASVEQNKESRRILSQRYGNCVVNREC
jgi:hypothetical protein